MNASMSSKRKKSKHWCITINNPTKNPECYYNPALMNYLILGKEVAPETGTPHYQGYMVFKKRLYLTGVRKLFSNGHLTIMTTNSKACMIYCKKENQFAEYGTPPVSNTASNKRKWAITRSAAKSGDFTTIPDDIYVRYYANIKKIRMDNPSKPIKNAFRDNYWVYGKTGVGKSHYARSKWPDFYDKNKDKWWDGYLGEATALIDDLDAAQCPYISNYLKRWCDIFCFRAQTKGSSVMIRPRRIVITSQFTIEECFYFDTRTRDALLGRFKIINLTHWKTRLPNTLLITS